MSRNHGPDQAARRAAPVAAACMAAVLLTGCVTSLVGGEGESAKPHVAVGARALPVARVAYPITATAPPVFLGPAAAERQAMTMLAKAVGETHKEMWEKCASFWGHENALLPSRKEWVFYDDGWLSRGVSDFEHGEFLAQVLVEPEGDPESGEAAGIERLRKVVDMALTDTPADLPGRDRVMKEAMGRMEEQGMPLPPDWAEAGTAPVGAQAVLAGILPADTAGRLSSATVTRTVVVGEDGRERTMLSYRVPFTEGAYAKLAERYAEAVFREAGEFAMPPSLILAVMETESAFNPRARSHIPAFGLMQLVPTSGGLDAHRFVNGESAPMLIPESLYDVDTNVRLGTAYLKLLDTRYLRDVDHPESRLYAAIAAYNTGAGNVARAFNGTTNIGRAAPLINRLPPEEVFDHLSEQLPFEETRRYLVKVTEARRRYLDWDRAAADAQLAARTVEDTDAETR
ncbi:transglycosylase SLT domain-containing protein [Skermanella sp. TT6]|uniref:Transglycosylase SLT domain-containing protein n=1 Tax=Skermanella cutis TaxID=2775420 RepID=A0ABX7BCU0_9PROT|nr:transglycosylase SLT domain-containing protein [Skermanella sp. TT6]QQP92212.1 transglycosylase SLT domain-containing protein [Skermanella sp. TT6]